MKIGIGIPATIPGVRAEDVMEWARRADSGPFSSLSIVDRLVYPNYEPLITLAALAGATQRVRLMTTVLLAPLRNAAVLAKQAATLDVISEGRLTLGIAVGGRQDDYRAASVSFNDRGKRFDEQLALMRRIWVGEPAGDSIGVVGPLPRQVGGPELLIGAISPAAIRRVGRWADGFITPGSPDSIQQAYSMAQDSWQAAGREGNPRLVGAAYFALGPNAGNRGAEYIRDYYAFMGDTAEYMAQSILTTPEAVQEAIEGFSRIDMDEFVLWPTVANLDQVDLLSQVVG